MDKENKFNKSNKPLLIKGEHGDIAVLHQIRSGNRNQSGQNIHTTTNIKKKEINFKNIFCGKKSTTLRVDFQNKSIRIR